MNFKRSRPVDLPNPECRKNSLKIFFSSAEADLFKLNPILILSKLIPVIKSCSILTQRSAIEEIPENDEFIDKRFVFQFVIPNVI